MQPSTDLLSKADGLSRQAAVDQARAARLYLRACEEERVSEACDVAFFPKISDLRKRLGSPEEWWWINQMKVADAQELIKDATPQLVAVVDSGIAPDMLFVSTRYRMGRNFTENPANLDNHGHGSAIAMLIGGERAVSGRPTGISKASQVLAVKVRDFGIPENPDEEEDGIRFAVDQGARIINLSLGDYRPFLSRSVDYAVKKGVLIVASAGHGKVVQFPARSSNVLSVNPVGQNGKPTSMASQGAKIDVCAPDANIGSSSYATALVSGLAALVLEANPKLSATEVATIIKSTARTTGEAAIRERCGSGIIDPVEAVRRALLMRDRM